MKKLVVSMVAIVLAASIITLCGCEATVSLDGKDNTTSVPTTYEEPTLVVEVTNEEGIVISTETVTMSAKDKEEEKNFYSPITQSGVSTGVSQDRVQQAIQNQQNATKPNPENSAPDINGNTGSTPAPELPYVQDDAEVLRSNQYMINVRLVDSQGIAQNYKIAKNGKYSSVSMVYNEVPMGVIIGGEIWYLLSVPDKMYLEIPKEQIEETAKDDEFGKLLMDDPFDFNRKVISETTEVEDGISYNVVEYDNGNKDYFIGKTIIKTTAEDNSVMYYDSVSPIAPMSLFAPPADYTKTTLTEDGASDIVGAIEPNAVLVSDESDE